jgi:hypothetical protein
MSYPAHSASLPRLIVRLFSGRPNPGLVLSEADVTEIRRILSKLPVTKAHAQPIADRPLGYSGMAILLGDGGEIDVFHEDVRVHPVIGPTQHFNDRESTLEQLLVAVARSRLAEPLPWNWITGRDSPSGS